MIPASALANMLLLLLAAVDASPNPVISPTSPANPPRALSVLFDVSSIASPRRRIAMSAARAFAAARSSASPVSRSAFASRTDSSAVRFSFLPSCSIVAERTLAPRAAAAALSPADLKSRASAGPPRLMKSKVIEAATDHPPPNGRSSSLRPRR